MTPKQIEFLVDAVTIDDIKRVANKYLWDKDVRQFPFFMLWSFVLTRLAQIAIAAVGPVEGLLDYNRIRADMSSLTY